MSYPQAETEAAALFFFFLFIERRSFSRSWGYKRYCGKSQVTVAKAKLLRRIRSCHISPFMAGSGMPQ